MRITFALFAVAAGCGPFWEADSDPGHDGDAGSPDAGSGDEWWYEPAQLSEASPGEDIDSLALFTDATGMTTLVWTEATHLFARRHDPMDGTWSPAVRVEPGDPERATTPQLGADGDGNVLAVWQQLDGMSWTIRASWFTDAVGWGTPVTLAITNIWSQTAPCVAVAAGGDAVAIWQRSNAAEIWGARYDAVQGWLSPYRLDDPGGSTIEGMDVAIDGDGHALALWSELGDAQFAVWARSISRLDEPPPPAASVVRATGGEPHLALNTVGDGVAVWTAGSEVEAATYRIATGFDPPITLSTLGCCPALGIAPAGTVVEGGSGAVTWSDASGVYLRRYDEGFSWLDPEVVVDESGAGYPMIAFNPEGEGLVAWGETSEPEYHVWAARVGTGAPLVPMRLDDSTAAGLGAVASQMVVWIQRDDAVSLWARVYR